MLNESHSERVQATITDDLSCRDDFVVATKAAGPSAEMTWIRGGPPALDAKNIMAAIEGSLTRLKTDYIDLYQLHWPDRCPIATRNVCSCDSILQHPRLSKSVTSTCAATAAGAK